MKISITANGATHTTNISHDDVILDDLLMYINGLLHSVGYSFRGKIGIVNEDGDDHVSKFTDGRFFIHKSSTTDKKK